MSNNFEIIMQEAVQAGILSAEEIQSCVMQGESPLRTYREWKKAGYRVKKGEKAVLKTKIWRKEIRKKEEDEKEEDRYYLVNASFFRSDQVEKM